MKHCKILARSGLLWVISFFFAAPGGAAAQAVRRAEAPAAASSPVEAAAAKEAQRGQRMEALRAARGQLIEEELALRQSLRGQSGAAREGALADWREGQATRREALREEAQALAESQPPAVLPFIEEIVLPPGATPELRALLLARAELQNDRVELRNRLREAAPEARQRAEEAFAKQSTARRQGVARLGAQVAAQAAQKPLAEVPPLTLPAGASPEMKAFLSARQARLVAQRDFAERLRQLPPSAQAQARAAWEQQQRPKRADLAEKARRLTEAAP